MIEVRKRTILSIGDQKFYLDPEEAEELYNELDAFLNASKNTHNESTIVDGELKIKGAKYVGKDSDQPAKVKFLDGSLGYGYSAVKAQEELSREQDEKDNGSTKPNSISDPLYQFKAHGFWDLKITRADNGYIIAKRSDDTWEVEVFQEKDELSFFDNGANKGHVIELLYSILNYYGEYGNKYNDFKLVIGYLLQNADVSKDALDAINKENYVLVDYDDLSDYELAGLSHKPVFDDISAWAQPYNPDNARDKKADVEEDEE